MPGVGSLQNDITQERVIDIALQYHALAPAAGNRTIVSGLFGVDFVLGSTPSLTSVSALDQPALITIPVNVAYSSVVADFSCLIWNYSFYSDNACNVHSVTLDSSSLVSAVICECTFLALHAVSISRAFNSSLVSETTYVQGTSVVNVSDSVSYGWPSERPRFPLKKTGMAKPDSNLISEDNDISNKVIGQDSESNLQMTPLSAYLAAGIGVVGIVVMCSLLYQIQCYWWRQANIRVSENESIMITGKDYLQVRRTLESTTSDVSTTDVESFLCFDFDQPKSPKIGDSSWNGPISSSPYIARMELRPPLPGVPSDDSLPTDFDSICSYQQ